MLLVVTGGRCRDIVLSAVGGLQCPPKDVSMPIADLGCCTNAVAVPNSHDAIAMGEKYLDHGWDFHWANEIPWFVTDKKQEIVFTMKGIHSRFSYPATQKMKIPEANKNSE